MHQTITKLSEFISFVEDLDPRFTLSRGQSKNYPLLPGALRLDQHSKRRYAKRDVQSFLEQFKVNSYQFMPNPWDVKNEVEWMLYAQHYGIPTYLMDFTTSHITSLLFAVENAFSSDSDDDAVVYFLNAEDLNRITFREIKIINVDDDSINRFSHATGPIVIQGRHLNARINAQRGCFVLFQDSDTPVPLENFCDEKILIKCVIESGALKGILSSLYSLGISFSHIYPELSFVAKDIVTKQSINDYLREI